MTKPHISKKKGYWRVSNAPRPAWGTNRVEYYKPWNQAQKLAQRLNAVPQLEQAARLYGYTLVPL